MSSSSKGAAQDFPVVGIGASAGGLEAFSDLLRHLPETTGMAYVVIQHLDPKHHSDLREILSRTTRIPVQEVTDGAQIKPNTVYVIPPNTSMALQDGHFHLAARLLTRGQHMPIDHFLHSLAEARGNRAIGVILSGTASDGTEGVRAVKAAGGITFAQDQESAKYGSMPHSAVSAGCIDFVLAPAEIAIELTRVARHPYLTPASIQALESASGSDGEMEVLLALLRNASGVDFTHYKPSTLQRRIKRRMVLQRIEKLKDYVQYARSTPDEVDELFQDILIHVTGFFRDPAAFVSLRKRVLPNIFKDKKAQTVRIWVPGCSTGEEVYSLAMTILEYLWLETSKTTRSPLGSMPFQIFATDISETALDRARAGLYSEALLADVPPERLRRFFVRLDGGYQIVKPVRELCVFARQNVAKDAPFSNMDLISCRNLLIYLGPLLQKRVIPTLHYALKPDGYLMLGESESLGAFADYFNPVDKKAKIFQKKKSATRLVSFFGATDFGIRRGVVDEVRLPREAAPVLNLEKEVDRLLMSRFVPASIVVNEEMEIIHLRGKTGAYLEPAAGLPTFSLSKMAREGLLVDLRAAISAAKKGKTTVRREGVRVQSEGQAREVNLEVTPLRGPSANERFYVIVFQEAISPAEKSRAGGRRAAAVRDGASRENAQSKRELEQLREQFQSLIEEHETTTEEFKSANEEVLSANEELQSTNEELETAKEELQSTNEELTTLNEELQNRNVELTSVNNDLLNLLGNVTVPVVIVDHDLRIRRFTPPAQKLMNLLPGDVGRRLMEIRPNLDLDDLGKYARETIENVVPVEQEVRETGSGTWFQMRVRPYKTWDNKIDGAVISFENIDALKRDVEYLKRHAVDLIEYAPIPTVVLDAKLRVVSVNESFQKIFGSIPDDADSPSVYQLANGEWDIPRLHELLENVLPRDGRVKGFEITHDFGRIGRRKLIINARSIEPQPRSQFILLYIAMG
ncbi:MAG TPA: chemotaxis protein CheB [Candidatus Binatia bacterium]|nr:chemotaxis protein CheB [Candidatus Binatia bacterium]